MKKRKRNCKFIRFLAIFIITENSNWQYWLSVFMIQQTEIVIHSFVKIRLFVALRFDMDDENRILVLQLCLDYNIQSSGFAINQIRMYFFCYRFNGSKVDVLVYVWKKCFDEFFEKVINQLLE